MPQIRLKPVEEESFCQIEAAGPNILVQALAEAIGPDPTELDPFEYDLRVEEVHSILEEMSKGLNIFDNIDENLPGGQGVEYFDDFERHTII